MRSEHYMCRSEGGTVEVGRVFIELRAVTYNKVKRHTCFGKIQTCPA